MQLAKRDKLYSFHWCDRNLTAQHSFCEKYEKYCGCCGFIIRERIISEVNNDFGDIVLEDSNENILFQEIDNLNKGIYTTMVRAKEGLVEFLHNKNTSLFHRIKSIENEIDENKDIINQPKQQGE